MSALRHYIDLNQIQEIPYLTDFENGTHYFDGVFKQLSVEPSPQISYFVDQHGRHAVLFLANNNQGIVVHERYSDNEDLLVLTQSKGISYGHSGTAIERLLNLPVDKVLQTLQTGGDASKFKELLDEKCYFDH